MTTNIRAAKALKRARSMMRDAAAANHSAAAAADASAAEAVVAREQDLEDTLDDALDAMAAASSVLQLDAIADAIAGGHHAVSEAHRDRATAASVADRAAGELRQRVRELKTSERVVDLIHRERTSMADRVEQRASDDRASTRKRGTP